MIALLGKDINLGFFFTRNNQSLTGQNVTVRVVNQAGGNELLAEIACPETSEPGIYNFVWELLNPTPPPLTIVNVIVFFKTRSKTFSKNLSFVQSSEDIAIITAERINRQSDAIMEIEDDKIKMVVDNDDIVIMKVDNDDIIIIEVEDDTIIINVDNDDIIIIEVED